ncbi:glycosyltransferase family A protein [Paraflavisolibacter sp. H34]|uniref:glycosyltransferase family 2 protein n=1 Tax=Huijunlia imazamoxiresistens TaxID=3127457 RepID=UPI00301B5C7B
MSGENRFFSIVIPLYNKESCLERTIDCVLHQTYPHFEILLIDDGSTDNSFYTAQALAATDNRIRLFSKSNGGVSSARNFGIGKACHPYIAFLDADDSWEACYLEEMNALIDRYPRCGMYGCAYKKVRHDRATFYCEDLPEGIIEDYFRTITFKLVAWTSALIIKKEVFEKVGLFPVGMIGGEDYFMWTKVAIHYPMAFTPKVLSCYNIFLSGVSGRIGQKDSCHENWYQFYRDDDFYRNEFIANKAIDNGIRHAWGNHKKHSRSIERQFRYTRLFRYKWYKLFFLNLLPQPLLLLLLFCKKQTDPLYAVSGAAKGRRQQVRSTSAITLPPALSARPAAAGPILLAAMGNHPQPTPVNTARS